MIIDKTFNIESETWILTKRDKKQINIFERKVYRRILGPICNWYALNFSFSVTYWLIYINGCSDRVSGVPWALEIICLFW